MVAMRMLHTHHRWREEKEDSAFDREMDAFLVRRAHIHDEAVTHRQPDVDRDARDRDTRPSAPDAATSTPPPEPSASSFGAHLDGVLVALELIAWTGASTPTDLTRAASRLRAVQRAMDAGLPALTDEQARAFQDIGRQFVDLTKHIRSTDVPPRMRATLAEIADRVRDVGLRMLAHADAQG
jgi:hypothetical protein